MTSLDTCAQTEKNRNQFSLRGVQGRKSEGS